MTALATAATTFSVAAGDQNLGDTLYVRWVADYPPYAANFSKILDDVVVPPPPVASEVRLGIPLFEAKCDAFAATGMQQHRLVAIISDRPFVMPERFAGDLRYSLVGTRLEGTAQVPVTYPVFAGWNFVCPSP